MATYTGLGFPPWATISESGLISISSSAPAGSATVNVEMLHSGTVYSKQILLTVTSPIAVASYFSLVNPVTALQNLTVDLTVDMFYSDVTKAQIGLAGLTIDLDVSQIYTVQIQELVDIACSVSLIASQVFVPRPPDHTIDWSNGGMRVGSSYTYTDSRALGDRFAGVNVLCEITFSVT